MFLATCLIVLILFCLFDSVSLKATNIGIYRQLFNWDTVDRLATFWIGVAKMRIDYKSTLATALVALKKASAFCLRVLRYCHQKYIHDKQFIARFHAA